MDTKDCFTFTFGESAENHVGMEKIGKELVEHGYTLQELEDISLDLEKRNVKCELVILSKEDQVGILVIYDGVNFLLKDSNGHDKLYNEQKSLSWDTKAYMKGRVVNKHARYNVCYAKEGRKANYENKMGTLIAYSDVPLLKKIRKRFSKYFGQKAKNLAGEGNYYYDIKKCGIGYHGDSERKIVIAVRAGAPLSLWYAPYQNSKRVDSPKEIKIPSGAVYIMSEGATGWNWKKKKIRTWRHAAGCSKYVS